MNCEICQKENPYWSWTDTHGIAQCMTCGTPYRLLHYEGEEGSERRVEKPPMLCIKREYVPVLQAYWNETKRMMPGGYSFPGGYELATRDDAEAFNAWMKQNATRLLAGENTQKKTTL